MAPRPVLVVEDDTDIRDSLVELLDDHGYEARGAANGREALELLASGPPPGIILLDLMMPIMDGWTFRAEQLRRPAVSAIPVVVLSAYKDVAKRAEGLHAEACLSKPIDLDALLAIVRTHCATPS